MSSNWFDRWFRGRSLAKRGRSRPIRRPVRLKLEQLENRLAPATWTGAADTLWSNNANWTNGLPTDASAQLIFPAILLSNNFTSNNDLPSLSLSISSIEIDGNTPYTITGNAITLGTGGFTVLNSTATHTVSLPFNLSGLGVGFGISSGATVSLTGVVSSGGGTTLNKNDQGALVLTTANPNLLGSINVNTGTLQVTNAQALGDTVGETTVSNDATATLQLSAGADTGTENVHLGGRILVDSNIHWGGFVDLTGSPGTIEVTTGNTFTLTGGPTGIGIGPNSTGSLLKAGAGTLVLAANSHVSGADLAAGVLNVRAASSTGSTTVESGAALEVQGTITLTTSGLTLNGTGTTGNGALLNVANNNTVQGAVTLGSASTIGSTAGTLIIPGNINNAGFLLTVNGAGNTVFDSTGVLSGTGGLTKNGAGTLTLSGTGANTYSGATTINQGAINIQKASALGATTTTVTASGAALQVQGSITFNAEPLTLNGTGISGTGAPRNVSGNNTWQGNITLGSASTIGSSAGTLRVTGNINNAGFLLTVNGAGSTVFDSAGVLNGTGGLTKTGTGTMILNGANTYTGPTTVNGGILEVNGAQGNSGAIVNSGGTLAGSGTVGTLAVNTGGTLGIAAGDNLTADGNSTFANQATFSANILGNSVGRLTATGTVFLNNATLRVSDVIGNVPLPFISHTIISAATVAGTFNGLPNGALVVTKTGSGSTYRVNYTATSVTLTRLFGPGFQDRAITSPIDEGSVATLTGHITTILPDDTFFLDVNWGDGSRPETFKFRRNDPRDIALDHRYLDDGTYAVGLLWRDQRGGFNTDTLSVTVNNVAPIVNAGGVAEFFRGGTLTRIVSFVDPGQDQWTATVDFGDGSAPQVIDLHGSNPFLIRHRYDQPGTYTVTVTLSDGDGGLGSDSFQVDVLPRPGK